MPSFDLVAAKKAGLTDTEIADFMGQKFGYDTAAARKAGITDQQIIGEMSSRVSFESAKPAPAIPSPAPQKDYSSISFNAAPTSTLDIATPRQKAEAQALREVITGTDAPRKPRVNATPELRVAPPKNFIERGIDAVREALSPYDDSDAMNPADIASASITLDSQKQVVPAKTVDVGGKPFIIPARKMNKGEYVDLLNPEGSKVRAVENFISGAGEGVKGVVAGGLGAMEALGVKQAKTAADALQADSINNPAAEGLSTEIGAGFGSLLTFLVPALGVNQATSLVAKLSPKIAKYAATGTMTGLEAATEGGNVYREMMAKGESEEEAGKAATRVFLANLPLNFLTDKAAFFPDDATTTFVKRAANSAQSEGLQESAQEYISQRSQPGKVNASEIMKAGAIGALTGGVVGGAKHFGSKDMLDPGRVDLGTPAPEATPAPDPLQEHMEANPQTPPNGPAAEPQAEPAPEPEQEPEAKPEPEPKDVPVNTVFKQPDGSTVKLTAVRDREGKGYVLKTTIKTPEGHIQTTNTHDPIPGSMVVEAIEKYRPAPALTQEVQQEVQPTDPATELTRQMWQEQRQAEVEPQAEVNPAPEADPEPAPSEARESLNEIEALIAEGRSNASMIPAVRDSNGVDPRASIAAYEKELEAAGWKRDGKNGWEKDGATLFLSSQGTLAAPIIQWTAPAKTPVKESLTAEEITAEEIAAEGFKSDVNSKGEIIVLKDGKNLAQRSKNGKWKVYEGGLSAKNLVGEDFTMREAAEELKGLREPQPELELDTDLERRRAEVNAEHAKRKAEQDDYAQTLAELEAKTFVEKRKGNKGFSSTSDFQETLKQHYPSVYSIGAKKEEVLAALQIGAGKGGKKVLTPHREEILDAFREDIARLKELYGDLAGDTEATDIYNASAEEIAADKDEEGTAFDFFDNIIKERERERGNREENQGVAGDAATGEADKGSEAVAEEPAENPAAEEVIPSYEQTEAGDQGVLLKGARELGKGKNSKAKGIAGLEDMELFTEPKDREAEKRQGGFGFDTGGYAERTAPTRATTQTFLELPEMIRLLKAINEDKLPRLKKRLGNALGRFTMNRATGEANVSLRKDLFAGPQIDGLTVKPAEVKAKWQEWQDKVNAENPGVETIFRQHYDRHKGRVEFAAYKKDPNFVLKVLAHEIGHAIDALPDAMVRGRGNILGHIAAMKRYMKETLEMYPDAPGQALSKEDLDRLKKDAADEVNSASEEIAEIVTRVVPKYEETGVTAEMITEIWNGMADARTNYPELYKFIAGLSDGEKKRIVVQAMKGLVDERLQALGRKQVGTETITETIWTRRKPTKAAIKARFEELVKDEVLKRRLYEKRVITEELKKLTQIWKPFTPGNDAYTKYRHSASELYADAVSVLFNEPQLLKDTAPTFYKAFFFHMGARPNFKAAYTALSRLSKMPQELAEQQYAEEMAMYRRGHDKANEIRRQRPLHETIFDTIKRFLIDRNHDVLKHLPDTPAGRKARYMLEEIPYISGEVENYVREANIIQGKVEEAGLSIDDLSAYMLAQHIIENRGSIANTQGKTEATEKAKLEYMEQKFGAEKMKVLAKVAEEFREARQHVLNRMEESGIVTDSLMEKIREREHYAHIDVQHYMDKQNGKGTSTAAGWKKMAEGTLSDINNVFVATVLQDMSILRMAKINESKRALTQVFDASGLAVKAEMKFDRNFGGKRPVEPGGDKALLTVLVNGKPIYYVVDKEVAAVYQYDPVRAATIGNVVGYIQGFFRDILVSKNPAWMLRNVYRDFKGTIKNNPEVAWWNPKDRWRLLMAYKEAFKEVRADVLHGKRSADIEMMRKEHMLVSDRAYAKNETTFDNELERLAYEFQFGSEAEGGWVRRKLQASYDYLERLGKISEQTSKVGGMKFLREKGLKGDELAHRVRTRVGTPDYKRQGALQQLSNNIFMFSNVGKEGIRSSFAAIKQDPISYAFKTVNMNVLPKLLLGLAIAGALGDELKEMAEGIPSWDRRSYSVIPLPGWFIQWAKDQGFFSEGANAYLRLPQDYEGQFFGALTYDITQGDFKGVARDVKGALPYKLHPLLALAVDWGQYLAGETPYDSFRQKDVLTREQQKYLEVEGVFNAKSLKGMALHTYGMVGLGNIHKLDNREFPKDQTLVEQLLKTTPISALGSYIQVNDSGRQEKLVETIRMARGEKAIASYEVGDAINDAVREGKTSTADMIEVYKKLRGEGKITGKFGSFRLRFKRAMAQKQYGIKPASKAELKMMATEAE